MIVRLIVTLCLTFAAFAAQDAYHQPWRPQYHFTPSHNFMNDPNGMVFYKGEYHLFYQFNPKGRVWGHMSWGHAVSTDLVHWHQLPLAIPEASQYMIYSGSAVVDWNNSSGLCKNPDPARRDHSCLIAIYAADYHQKREKTHIAYSNDRGRTWTNYSGNPVIDVDAEDFRDPYVFWYAPQKKWVLVAVLADHRKVLFFSSTDLKHWTKLSEFGPASDDRGQWECPLLMELPIEETNETGWVLVINRNPGAPAGGTGVRYLVGEFDGTQFTEYGLSACVGPPDGKTDPFCRPETQWADYGKDFYATNTFNDMPQEDSRKIWMGWASNWLYARDEPTVLWRGAQSIPRTLALRPRSKLFGLNKALKAAPGTWPAFEFLLVQEPVRELQSLRGRPFHLSKTTVQQANNELARAGIRGETYEIEAELEPGSAGEIGFRLRKGPGVETVVGVLPANYAVFVDRGKSGDVSFNKDFPGRYYAWLPFTERIKLHIFVDRSSVEIFVNDGEKVMTNRIYPPAGSTGIELYSKYTEGKVLSFTYWPLQSIWGSR